GGVRNRIVDDEKSGLTEDSPDIRPPPRILGSLRIQKDEVEAGTGCAFEPTARVAADLRDGMGEAGPFEIRGSQSELVFRGFDGGNMATYCIAGMSNPES